MKKQTTDESSHPGLDRDLEEKIGAALREIRFGTVTLVIQDGRVIQIDKSEKIRLR